VSASRGNSAQLLRDAATAYKVDTEAIAGCGYGISSGVSSRSTSRIAADNNPSDCESAAAHIGFLKLPVGIDGDGIALRTASDEYRLWPCGIARLRAKGSFFGKMLLHGHSAAYLSLSA